MKSKNAEEIRDHEIIINYQRITPTGGAWRRKTVCRLKRHALWIKRMADRSPAYAESAAFYAPVIEWEIEGCDDCTPAPFFPCWRKWESRL